VKSSIEAAMGHVEVVQNSIPSDWKNMESFKGRTEETHSSMLHLHPYVGAFEIRHEEILLYSKLACRLWPNCKVVADKIKAYFQDRKSKTADIAKYHIKYTHPSAKLPRIFILWHS